MTAWARACNKIVALGFVECPVKATSQHSPTQKYARRWNVFTAARGPWVLADSREGRCSCPSGCCRDNGMASPLSAIAQDGNHQPN
eukprot:62623-Chlamydomonas_euryale.AAC.4